MPSILRAKLTDLGDQISLLLKASLQFDQRLLSLFRFVRDPCQPLAVIRSERRLPREHSFLHLKVVEPPLGRFQLRRNGILTRAPIERMPYRVR